MSSESSVKRGTSAENALSHREVRWSASALLARLRRRLATNGRDWRHLLFETIAQWPLAEEQLQDDHRVYLVGGEAFDWRALADRLLAECHGMIPAEARESLLLGPDPPEGISEEDFRRILGVDKYRGHLNFLYGVIIEDALLVAVEEEIRKRRVSHGYAPDDEKVDLAYEILYRSGRQELLHEFRRERAQARGESKSKARLNAATMTLREANEFTYWLFRRRFKVSDPARFASDTRKALDQMERIRKAHEARLSALRSGQTYESRRPNRTAWSRSRPRRRHSLATGVPAVSSARIR